MNKECDAELDETPEHVTRLEYVINVIEQYEVIMAQKTKMIKLLFKQGCILKKLNNTGNFFELVIMDRSAIYFKITLYNLVKKYLHLQNSTLFDNYFKKKFKEN